MARCGSRDAGAKGVDMGCWCRNRGILEAVSLGELGISIPEERKQKGGVAWVRTALGLGEMDMVIGQFKVSSIYLSWSLCRCR